MAERDWDEKAIFLWALCLSKDQRDAFLDTSGLDEAARSRISALLHQHDDSPNELLTVSMPSGEGRKQPEVVAEFKIIRRLGEGGMGVVYLAEDTILGRRVALKMLARHMTGSEQALARFREEARSAAALTHPVIVPVHKYGFDGTDYYLVSEFVDGPTLSQLIAETRTTLARAGTQDIALWHRRSAEIIAAIGDGLDAAHKAKIVHRDLKPSNILLDREHGPRLTDFGIAKNLTDESRTQTALIGTCHYMSPEQATISGGRIDHRSDIFSLGVVLYEMLSLRLPFTGSSIPQILAAVSECNPTRLRMVDRRIHRDLETICCKAMEKRPQDRYPTAAHVSADLRCYLAGEPILAKPPSLVRRVRRFGRRRYKHLAALAMVGLGALCVMIWRQRVDLERQQVCVVELPSDHRERRLLVRPIEPVTHEPGEAIEYDSTPESVTLARGQYRIVSVGIDGAFAEATLLLLRPGVTTRLRLPEPVAPESPIGMVFVKGGDVVCGKPTGRGHRRERTVHVKPFYIDATEVSNAQYKAFIDATHHPAPQIWSALDKGALADHPVVGIGWDDACTYCQYMNKRLPTAVEWECAMRSPDDRLLPWGVGDPVGLPIPTVEDMRRASDVNLETCLQEYARHTYPVRSRLEFSSPLGLFHGATNVSEFTETVILGTTNQSVLKGASWTDSPRYFDSADFTSFPLETPDDAGAGRAAWSIRIGFRCARSAEF